MMTEPTAGRWKTCLLYTSNAADDVADYFQIERASAYRRKNRALERLTILLFGKA